MKPAHNNHTIVLLQPKGDESRTYTEYESVRAAVEGLCDIFEQNTNTQAYTVQDVVDFYKGFEEVMFLEFDNELSNYIPYDTDTVCTKIHQLAPV